MVPAMCYDKLQAQVVAAEQFQTSPAKEKESKFVWLNVSKTNTLATRHSFRQL